ncbi:unnamed protein product [Arabis nemorensis]|uniref:C2 domain-containing protein n=1 Tax=Arabis nemorensis TaxID=586526 RepID=A0A565BX69_9BRAS|nr:unnamed protein product [Arabis nemorensis]
MLISKTAAKKDDFSIKKISPKLGRERGARNPNEPTSSHDLVEPMEFLYVEVMKVINTPKTCIPTVEITLGNHKSSTKDLPIGPNMDLNQVFAFDKTKDDVLNATLSLEDDQSENGRLVIVGKKNFKLAEDIPSRAPPDARIVPQWYSMNMTETGHPVMLLMSVSFGTQADEVYSYAWFSDSFDGYSCFSGHELSSNDGKQTPSVYVKATLGDQVQKTKVSFGSNPTWNQELMFVASEPLYDTVYISLIDQFDDQQEECIGRVVKKLSEMNAAVKVPGTKLPISFYDIEPAVEGDSRQCTLTASSISCLVWSGESGDM